MTQPYRRLDKSQAALLLVDHLAGLLCLVRDIEPDRFKNNVLALADPRQVLRAADDPDDQLRGWPERPAGARAEADLPEGAVHPPPGPDQRLGQRGLPEGGEGHRQEELIIAGVVTEVCVAFPALSAIAEGYEVFVITDASGTFNEVTRDAAWQRMTAAGVQLMTWFGAACELHRDWRNDVEGLGALFSNHIPDYRNLITSYSTLKGR
jgi:Isochorismatase family